MVSDEFGSELSFVGYKEPSHIKGTESCVSVLYKVFSKFDHSKPSYHPVSVREAGDMGICAWSLGAWAPLEGQLPHSLHSYPPTFTPYPGESFAAGHVGPLSPLWVGLPNQTYPCTSEYRYGSYWKPHISRYIQTGFTRHPACPSIILVFMIGPSVKSEEQIATDANDGRGLTLERKFQPKPFNIGSVFL